MRKIFKIKLIIISVVILNFFLFNNVIATTIPAKSCSYVDVKAAYDAADEGDTILVPPGSAVWTNALTITKGIKLFGAGSGCPDSCVDNTTIKSGETDYLIEINPKTPSDNPYVEIKGFTFNGQESGHQGVHVENKSIDSYYTNFRIHRNSFKNFMGTSMSAIHAQGFSYGLIDHNYFYNNMYDVGIEGKKYSSWADYPKETGLDTPDFDSLGMGGSDFLYIENNVSADCHYRPCMTGFGARFVYRYNTITIGPGADTRSLVDMHGDYGAAATLAGEIYHNTVTATNPKYYYFSTVYWRGGTAIIFDNDVTFRTSATPEIGIRFDYACDYRTGSGEYDMKPHNGYIWNNTSQGKNMYIHHNAVEKDLDPYNCVVCGIDYWADTKDDSQDAQDAYVFASDTTAPTTCSVGDVFWDTDYEKGSGYSTGGLYKCTETNTWTWVYSPYTYPHPLRNNIDENQVPGAPYDLNVQ